MNPALFVSAQLHEREITLPDGTAAIFHFKKLPAVEWTQHQFALSSRDEGTAARSTLRVVMLSLCDPNGSQALTWEQATQLDPDVAQQMWAAVHAICRPDPKTSRPGAKTGSGTS